MSYPPKNKLHLAKKIRNKKMVCYSAERITSLFTDASSLVTGGGQV